VRKLRPINNLVLVEPDAVDEEVTTASGIITPFDSPGENKGEVVAVGPGALDPNTGVRRPCHVKVGDRVLFGSMAGERIEHDGKTCVMMNDNEVMGILNAD